MPQKVIAKQMSLESASDPIAVVATVETVPSETVAVESYADRLMDELFEGVDRAFDGSEGLPAEQVPPAEFVALKSISVPQIVLSQLAPEPPRGGEQEVAAIARQVALETTKKQQSKQSFDRILLGAACGSLLLVMGLWLASRSGLVRLPAAPTPQTPAASGKIAPDTQFVEYVQRSLVAIEQKKAPQANSQLATVPGAATPGTLPSISISGAPPATAGLSTAVNRIANALEQAAAGPGAPAPQVVVIPPPAQVTVAPAPTQVTVAVPGASQTAAGSPSPSASASGRAIATAGNRTPLAASSSSSESSVQPKILARETESAPAPAPAAGKSAPAPQQSAAAVSGAPTSAQTLVGILELGDRSAALFEVDGVARRIYVGESIGASGWTLAEIKNQEAVIRKGGDVRSVFVGQKF
jgi:Tfp pilus assembly protein PilP